MHEHVAKENKAGHRHYDLLADDGIIKGVSAIQTAVQCHATHSISLAPCSPREAILNVLLPMKTTLVAAVRQSVRTRILAAPIKSYSNSKPPEGFESSPSSVVG